MDLEEKWTRFSHRALKPRKSQEPASKTLLITFLHCHGGLYFRHSSTFSRYIIECDGEDKCQILNRSFPPQGLFLDECMCVMVQCRLEGMMFTNMRRTHCNRRTQSTPQLHFTERELNATTNDSERPQIRSCLPKRRSVQKPLSNPTLLSLPSEYLDSYWIDWREALHRRSWLSENGYRKWSSDCSSSVTMRSKLSL